MVSFSNFGCCFLFCCTHVNRLHLEVQKNFIESSCLNGFFKKMQFVIDRPNFFFNCIFTSYWIAMEFECTFVHTDAYNCISTSIKIDFERKERKRWCNAIAFDYFCFSFSHRLLLLCPFVVIVHFIVYIRIFAEEATTMPMRDNKQSFSLCVVLRDRNRCNLKNRRRRWRKLVSNTK